MNEGAGGDVHYVIVEQDPAQRLEDCLTARANKGKPPVLSLTYVLFKFMQLSLYSMCIYVQELNETLVA
jgi:hypothetical protein